MKSEEKRFAYIDLRETVALIFVVAYHSTIFPYNILYSIGKKDYICYILRTFFPVAFPYSFLQMAFCYLVRISIWQNTSERQFALLC